LFVLCRDLSCSVPRYLKLYAPAAINPSEGRKNTGYI
jgi:hypothetical protein